MYWGSWAACLPAIQRQTGASEAQLGLALLCVAVASLPAMLAAGRLADLFGARLVPVALAVFGVAVIFPGRAHSLPALYVSLAFVGVGTGALDVAIYALPTLETDERLHRMALYREQFMIVIEPNHRLAMLNAVRVKDLRQGTPQ